MPITVADRIEQTNRQSNVRTSDFFHTMNTSDIDFSVQAILTSGGDAFVEVYGNKYIIKNVNASPLALPNLGSGDIVIYNGTEWVIYKSVANQETNFGLVYDKNTKLFYQYDAINGWVALYVRKNGTIDGGTFG
jgi:hypothetical protein